MGGMMRTGVMAAAALLLSGCDADQLSTDDPVWHLSVQQSIAPPRHVATFDREPGADGSSNHARCIAVQTRLQADRTDLSYSCAVGRYRSR